MTFTAAEEFARAKIDTVRLTREMRNIKCRWLQDGTADRILKNSATVTVSCEDIRRLRYKEIGAA